MGGEESRDNSLLGYFQLTSRLLLLKTLTLHLSLQKSDEWLMDKKAGISVFICIFPLLSQPLDQSLIWVSLHVRYIVDYLKNGFV